MTGDATDSTTTPGEPGFQNDVSPTTADVGSASQSFGLPIAEEMGPPYPPLEPRYMPPNEVDVPAKIRSDIDLPQQTLGDEPGAGRIVLSLLIDSNGAVDEVLVEFSQLSQKFSDAAAEAFRRGQFSPATKNGVAVPSRARIEVVFGYQRPMPSEADQ